MQFFGLERIRSTLLWGLGIGLALATANILAKVVMGQSPNFLNPTYGFASAILVAPVVEEIAFRGIIQQRLGQKQTFWIANLITSLLFVGIDMPGWYFQERLWDMLTIPIGGGSSIFALSLLFGWVYHRSKSLSAAILVHALNNVSV